SEGPAILRARTEVLETEASASISSPSPAPAPSIKATPAPTAVSNEAVSSAGVASLFTSPPGDLKTLVIEGVKELEKLVRVQTGSSLGDNVEAFRQAIFNKMGFNSTLFELARAVRDLKAIPGPLNASQQQQYIDRFRMWASKLAP
ncbi:MAG: hypothetical protein GYA24_11430, partial [Candidatus Lokiarchaeota archaeon]|nr:hypothetical protein [Candidatus Lokiarchaeota archaeon]